MSLGLRIAGGLVGAAVVLGVIDAAVRTFVLPRGAPVLLTRLVARANRRVFDSLVRPTSTYEWRDRVMALYGPVTLLTFPAVWTVLIVTGFALLFRAVGTNGWLDAFRASGSSMLTLGFAVPDGSAPLALVLVEATIGLTVLAMLISYLPTIYGAFSDRELAVTQLGVRAGSPPSPVELLIRAHRAGFVPQLDDVWRQWELWFVQIEETHTSLPILSFFRSPEPERSWVVAAGVVLDAAALRYAVLDIPFTPYAGLCIRSGYLSLRTIARFFGIPHDPDPRPDDPITVSRSEFDEVVDRLAVAGVPVRTDRDEAWRAYAGWRVNYDQVLVALAALVVVPTAPWISDRSSVRVRPPLRAGRTRGDRGTAA